MKFDPVTEIRPTNGQIAKGLNDIHQCLDNVHDRLDKIEKRYDTFSKFPGVVFRRVLLPITIGIAILAGQNFLYHSETSQKQDQAVKAADTAAEHAASTDNKVTTILTRPQDVHK